MDEKKAQKTENSALEMIPASYQFNLSDFALFLSVMKNRRAYEGVLSIILNEKDLILQEIKVEQVVLNHSGKRAIRLDAWAKDRKQRQINTEMQNDANQDDIFKNDLAKYTFSEQCEEIPGLFLEDGTKKIFLNMTSRNGRPELISLLQYMKNTTLDNPEITVRDERILELDRIVTEVKQSEEWEAVKMNILEIGLEKGREEGKKEGRQEGHKEGVQKGTIMTLGGLVKDGLLQLKDAAERAGLSEEVFSEKMKEYGL